MSINEWVAIGGLTLSIIGLIFEFIRRSKQQAIKDAEREQKQADQHDQVMEELKRVSKRLDEHNGYAEKFSQTTITLTALSKDVEWIKEKLK